MKLERISQGSAWSGYITLAIRKSGRNKIGGNLSQFFIAWLGFSEGFKTFAQISASSYITGKYN